MRQAMPLNWGKFGLFSRVDEVGCILIEYDFFEAMSRAVEERFLSLVCVLGKGEIGMGLN